MNNVSIIEHAHLFQRVVNPAGHGFVSGTITLNKKGSEFIQEGIEYIFGNNGGFIVDGNYKLNGKPSYYEQGCIGSHLSDECWTGIETPGVSACRLIPIAENDTQRAFLIYGAFTSAPFDKKLDTGDFFEINDGFLRMTAPPVSTMGQTADTLMRLPIWKIGTHPGVAFAIEPTSTTLFNELRESNRLKLDFFTGKIDHEYIAKRLEGRTIHNPDLYSVGSLNKGTYISSLNKEFFQTLAIMDEKGELKAKERITDIDEVKRSNKAMRQAIKEVRESGLNY
jgi:hypothetical protein